MATEQQKKYTNYNAFRKKSYERNPFEDPTYLSFTISFVYDKGAGSSYHNMLGASPLFNGKAYDYLKDFCMDDDRAYSLEKFTELLTYKTKIVAVTHCSNIVGSVNDLFGNRF